MSIRTALSILALFAIGGLVLFAWGWSDHGDSKTASAEPAVIDLADLEKEKDPKAKIGNNHVKIGPHMGCYNCLVYQVSVKKKRFGKEEEVKPDTKVNHAYYPIISSSNPAIEELKKKYGSLDKIPDSDKKPPSKLVVVVKTTRYGKVQDIPSPSMKMEQQVQGLILNRTGTLGSDEKKLLKEDMPAVNFDEVLVLEDGRSPSSDAWCYARMGLGVLSVLFGFGIVGVGFVVGRSRQPAA